MNFCRRCGQGLNLQKNHIFQCKNGHTLFKNASPATTLILVNNKGEVGLSVRNINPGKGMLDFPGGFCDGAETLEHCLAREIQEECGLSPHDYSPAQYLTSFLDDYNYKGETIKVLTACFWAQIKSGVTITPSDDVAQIVFMAYDNIDLPKLQWPHQFSAVEQLQQQGIV